jgi:hypothetical protein
MHAQQMQQQRTMVMETVLVKPQRYVSSTPTYEQTHRGSSAGMTADVGQRLTTGESALLLGAFATLAASMASFITL